MPASRLVYGEEEGNKTRVQLDMSPVEIQRLNWIMEICDLHTRKDLFNNALTLLEWAARETCEGRKIASFRDELRDRFILSMPALSAAASRCAEGRPKVAASRARQERAREKAAAAVPYGTSLAGA